MRKKLLLISFIVIATLLTPIFFINAQGTTAVGDLCKNNSDCISGICDKPIANIDQGTCICSKNSDCSTDQFCDIEKASLTYGQCLKTENFKPCQTDADCQANEYCNTAFNLNLCVPEPPSTTGSALIGGVQESTEDQGQSGVQQSPKVTETLPNFLKTSDPNVIIGRIIKALIGIAGSLALLMFIYGGVMWLISRGNTAYIEKGKKAMMLAAIGLVIIFTSYILVKLIITALGALD